LLIESFHDWGAGLVTAARDRHGIPASNIRYLAERPERLISELDEQGAYMKEMVAERQQPVLDRSDQCGVLRYGIPRSEPVIHGFRQAPSTDRRAARVPERRSRRQPALACAPSRASGW
jgi:hypothetical protein